MTRRQAAKPPSAPVAERVARELLILHPVRDDAVLPQPPHLVRLVVLEVALEPLDVAVALERQDMLPSPLKRRLIPAAFRCVRQGHRVCRAVSTGWHIRFQECPFGSSSRAYHREARPRWCGCGANAQE